MATNNAYKDGQGQGAVKERSQTLNPKTGTWVKRDSATGKFIDGKSDNKLFKDNSKGGLICSLKARHDFSSAFPGAPIVLMTQDSRGVPTYQGREDLVNFLASVHPSRIPWKRYTLN